MVESKESQELNPEEQATFDHDLEQLRTAGKEHGIKDFGSRTKFGLDPAAMLSIDHKKAAHGDTVQIEGTKEYAKQIANSLGANEQEVFDLIHKLHKEGPWANASDLSTKERPDIKTYLVLAAACQESGWPGLEPAAYIKDRNRVVEELKTFTPDVFPDRIKTLEDRVAVDTVVDSDGVKVPIAEGDVALPLSMQGFEGCVSKAGEMRFAQTENIPNKLLENAGLVKGFGEVYDPSIDGFKRVPADTEGARIVWVEKGESTKNIEDMEPSVKRIAPGYLLTYTNQDLAINLVAEAIKASHSK